VLEETLRIEMRSITFIQCLSDVNSLNEDVDSQGVLHRDKLGMLGKLSNSMGGNRCTRVHRSADMLFSFL
jgi:hypothetical protein